MSMQHAVGARWIVHKRDTQTVLTFSTTVLHTKPAADHSSNELREHAHNKRDILEL